MGFNHVIPNLAERFFNKESPFLMNGYNQTRAFCFISDAIAGTFAAMESNNTNGEIYHIGTEDEVSIKELIKQTGKYFKFKGDYKKAETFPGSTNRRCPNIQKAIKDFAYEPKISLKEGLLITLKWYADYFNK
jgi:UDP-glucose 4-epimerase/UDP-glucuronate decarboxylase